MLPYILIIIGFILLIKGADFLVDGAASISKKLHISDIVIGLTIVAFGTSAPEFVVNIIGSMSNANDMVLGNIIGSNLSNILLILGLTASIKALNFTQNTIRKEIPFALFGGILLAVLINNAMRDGSVSSLSAIDGMILLGFFAVFVYYTFRIAKNSKASPDNIAELGTGLSVVYVLGGIVAVALGGKLVVDNALDLATMWGWSEKLIGVTILAIGTSLPELATSLVAVTKSKADIAVGNIVGSNIFNIFFVLGITALVSPVVFDPSNNTSILANILVHILLLVILFVGKKNTLQRWQGVVFVVLYLVFLGGMFWLG